MALVVVIDSLVSATTISFRDRTGTYDALTNPTGYGAPNAAFADYAHYIIIRKKAVGDDSDEVLVPQTYDPLSALTFTVTRATDGWYEAIKLNITKWSAGSLPAETVRYHSGNVYVANSTTSSTPGSDSTWDVVSDLTDIEDNATVIATTLGKVTPYDADVYLSKQMAENSKAGRLGIAVNDKDAKRLDLIRFHIQCANTADGFGNYEDGEWNVQALMSIGAKRAA